MDKMLSSSEVRHARGEKPKKKRKERSDEGIHLIANGAHPNNLPPRNENYEQRPVNE